MRSAFIIGGSGQIGIAIARRLCTEGWDVVVGSRNPPAMKSPWRHVKLDIREANALQNIITKEFDLIVSCIAFNGVDAHELLKIKPSAGRILAISSASVYQDSAGRTLDEAKDCGFPSFEEPINEQTSTVSAGSDTYSTKKIQMENELLANATVPVTILRPCAIHGPYSKHAREWWFVKRLMDGRRQIPLAYGGLSQFQTTSVSAISDTVIQACEGKLPPIVNVADSDTPTVAEIGETIIKIMNTHAELIPLPDEAYPPTKGATPWSVQKPYICSSVVKNNVTYAQSVPDAIHWLINTTSKVDWRTLLPQLAAYPHDHFDYRVDDSSLTGLKNSN